MLRAARRPLAAALRRHVEIARPCWTPWSAAAVHLRRLAAQAKAEKPAAPGEGGTEAPVEATVVPGAEAKEALVEKREAEDESEGATKRAAVVAEPVAAVKATPEAVEGKTVTADLVDAIVPYGRDRLVLFVDDERWRYRLIAGLNVMHVGFWYFNWVFVFPGTEGMPTPLGPAGLAVSGAMALFFYWQASQAIAGVFYNKASREIEMLPYSSFGAADKPISISPKDIQLSQRSTDHFLFVKRRDDRLFMTIDRKSGTVVHDKLLMAGLAGEQLVLNKVLESDEVQDTLKRALPLETHLAASEARAKAEAPAAPVAAAPVDAAACEIETVPDAAKADTTAQPQSGAGTAKAEESAASIRSRGRGPEAAPKFVPRAGVKGKKGARRKR